MHAKLKLLYPESDHIMLGYTVKTFAGHQDNSEYGAGKKILQTLLKMGHNNTAVFVSKDFGGIHLGPQHHLFIEREAKDALKMLYPV